MGKIAAKRVVKVSKKAPPPGRKMTAEEARNYVFKKYSEAMSLLAKN